MEEVKGFKEALTAYQKGDYDDFSRANDSGDKRVISSKEEAKRSSPGLGNKASE